VSELADYGVVSETIQVGTSSPAKRVHRTAEEKRRIVEATLVPGVSIARVARENGVNANQVFQWQYACMALRTLSIAISSGC
jgi:transposase